MNSTASAALTSAENTARARGRPPRSEARASRSSAARVGRARASGNIDRGDHAEQRPARSRSASSRARSSRRRSGPPDCRARRAPSAAVPARRRTPARAAQRVATPDGPADQKLPVLGVVGTAPARPRPSRRRRSSTSGSGDAKPASFTMSCTTFTHARLSEPACHEVAGDDHAADDVPTHFGVAAATTFRIDADRDQLPREDGERSTQSRSATMPRTLGAVAESRGNRRRCAGRAPPRSADRRADPERERNRSDRRRPHPPPRRDAIAIAEAGRADRRSGADVGREHRRKDERRAEPPSGDEEIRSAAGRAVRSTCRGRRAAGE